MTSKEINAEFDKAFGAACGGRGRFEAWADFIRITAYSMAVAVGQAPDVLAKSAEEASGKYTAKEQAEIRRMYSAFLDAYELNRDQDYLGSRFMELGIGSKELGQFFTPYNVSKPVAAITMEGQPKERFITIGDPTCGAGAMLIACSNILMGQDRNPQTDLFCVGRDINEIAALMAYVQLGTLGIAAKIEVGDTLEDTVGYSMYTPIAMFGSIWTARAMKGEI